jgi:hypothetical protein
MAPLSCATRGSTLDAGHKQQSLLPWLLLLHCRSGLGVEPVDEGRCLLQYLVGRGAEGQLVGFLGQLEGQAGQLGVADVQASLASLEEVFLTIAKRVRRGDNSLQQQQQLQQQQLLQQQQQ